MADRPKARCSMVKGALFQITGQCHPGYLSLELAHNHYLGSIDQGFGWNDEFGCAVWKAPTSRRLPVNWLELARWCLRGIQNGGTQQFKAMRKWLLEAFPLCTTLVSYSDPSVGHTGALYRACNWLWAPTWHRIVTPPTGNGSWNGVQSESVKDRWVFPLRRDSDRVGILRLEDSYVRRFPYCEYKEPDGADWKVWHATR